MLNCVSRTKYKRLEIKGTRLQFRSQKRENGTVFINKRNVAKDLLEVKEFVIERVDLRPVSMSSRPIIWTQCGTTQMKNSRDCLWLATSRLVDWERTILDRKFFNGPSVLFIVFRFASFQNELRYQTCCCTKLDTVNWKKTFDDEQKWLKLFSRLASAAYDLKRQINFLCDLKATGCFLKDFNVTLWIWSALTSALNVSFQWGRAKCGVGLAAVQSALFFMASQQHGATLRSSACRVFCPSTVAALTFLIFGFVNTN